MEFASLFLKPLVPYAIKGLVNQMLPSELQRSIDHAVSDWVNSLPEEFVDLSKEAVLNGFSSVSTKEFNADSPWVAVCEMILSGTVPTDEFWFAALKQHWAEVHARVGSESQEIFKAATEAVEVHLKNLSHRLHTACAQLPTLFGPDAHRRLIVVQDALANIEGLLQQAATPKSPRLDFWPINGNGRNVITGQRNLRKGGSGRFYISIQFAIRSNVQQTIRTLEVEYFQGRSRDIPFGHFAHCGEIDDKEWVFGLDGNLQPPLECKPLQLYTFYYRAELFGRDSWAGPEGTDYGRGQLRLGATDSEVTINFCLNPGGIMLQSEDGWIGPQEYYYD